MAGQVMLFLLLLLWAWPAWATVYWVSPSLGGTGNCGNAQGATPPANYLRTISAGMSCLASGDTLFVRSGTYVESLTGPWVSGSSGQYTRIARYQNEGVTVRPSGGITGFRIEAVRQYIEIDGINFDGVNLSCTPGVGIIHDTFHFRLKNSSIGNASCGQALGEHADFTEIGPGNTLHDSEGYGLYFGGTNAIIEGNTFRDNGGYGIHFYGENPPGTNCGCVNDNTARNNIFTRNGCRTGGPAGTGQSAAAIILSSGSRNKVYNNVIYDNWAGIYVAIHGDQNEIYGNTLHNNTVRGNAGGACNFQDSTTTGINIDNTYGASNNIARNNISIGHSENIRNQGTNTTLSNNLISGNPMFIDTAGGNFRIATAGSPAVNAGFTLSAPFNTDIEGSLRPPGQFTIGAYQFAGTAPPPPIGNFAKWTFEEGTSTSAADSSGQGHTCTLNTVGWGAGIIGNFSLNAAGVRECHVSNTTGMRPTANISGGVWLNGTPNGDYGYLVDMGGVWGLWHDPAGQLVFFINGGAQYVATSGINILTGTNRHVAWTKDANGLRLWVDGIQGPTFTPTTTPIVYTGSEQFFVGRNALQVGNYFPGRIDQVYLFDTPLDQATVTQLFNEYVPTSGMSVTHSRFTTANVGEGVFSAPLDTDDTRLVGQPVGIRWAIHRGDAGSLTEYFRVHCRVNTGAGYGAWTEVGNSFLGLGIRFYDDPAIALGQATSALLPLEGASATPGVFLENPVDTTAPYDAGQRLTIALGQHAELEARLELGAPLVATNTVQCRPYRENATVFESYGGTGDPAIRTLTLAVPNVARALMGVQVIGGAVQ